MFDCGILNGRIFTGEGFFDGSVYFQDGKVAALTKTAAGCEKTVDAGGRMVLPGLIDPHVHMELTVGENTSRDDFARGTKEAALGGVTSIIDFLDPVKTVAGFEKAFEERMCLAANSVVDYGLHAAVAQPEDDVPALFTAFRQKGISSVKLFTTYSSTGRRTYDDRIDALLQASREMGVRVLVHAENDELVREGPGIPVRDHERARPMLCELTEVLKLAEIARLRDGLLYIVHLNAGSTAERLRALYADALGRNIVLESCPHYFALDSSVYERPDGYRFTMTPPLRSREEQQKLRENFDRIDVMATDHCPFDDDLKNRAFVDEIPMGVGGVKFSLSVMFTLFGERVLPKFTVSPAKIHGLYPRKGTLLPGADADAVIFDPDETFRVEDADSVYRGMELRGRVKATFAKGRELVRDGVFIGDPETKGEYLKREAAK